MLLNYLKIGIRNIRKYKIYFLINMSGLSLGMACCILIFLYVGFELSYDRYHNDMDRLYRVAMKIERESIETRSARISTPVVPAIKNSFPEVEHATRFQTQEWRRNLVERENEKYYESLVMVADNEIFNVLTIPFSRGQKETALNRPNTVVITQSMAVKYFAQNDPIGQMILIWQRPFEVTGVVYNAPENTHVKYGFIISLASFENEWNMDNWGWTGFYSYLKLKPGIDPDVFEGKIRQLAHQSIPKKLIEWGETYTFYLQPISKIHLHSHLFGEIDASGNRTYLFVLSLVGFFILFLSIINFTNLSTAKSAHRSKEVGIRKVVGAQRRQLVQQFLTDSLLTAFISTCGAVIISILSLPFFNSLTGKLFRTQDLGQPVLILLLFGLTIFVGISGGCYPAFLLSFLRPSKALEGAQFSQAKGQLLKKILVLSQFSVTIFLMIGTLVVVQQLKYMKNKPLGFEKEQKLIIPAQFNENYDQIKAEFLKNPSITGAAACWSVPGRTTNRITAKLVGKPDDMSQSMDFLYIDADYIPEYKIEIVAGRSFDRDMRTDLKDTFIINMSASNAFGFLSPEEAIGQRMYEGGSGNVGTIIGVIQDFHFKGLQSVVDPLIFQFNPSYFIHLSLTLKTENISTTLSFIEEKWNELRLGKIYNYFFLDEDFNRQYASEELIRRVATVFTFVAIFISCLGLFGLAAFTAEQKTKEIGIRKILGASEFNVYVLLSADFLKWVAIANILAWPTAYYAMHKWLQGFAFRTTIRGEVFLISAGLALIISIFTISLQTMKASRGNPVDSLRYE
ncbi:ABC transporter permease [Acidobacteriota bacterium]